MPKAYLWFMFRPTLFVAVCALGLATACGQKGEQAAETASTDSSSVPAEMVKPMSKAEIGAAYMVEGDTVAPEGAQPVDSVEKSLLASHNADFKVKGTVASACQVKGCWMKVKMPSGKLMHVTFKDYGFFVPKDIAGKEVIFEGYAYNDTLSVEELRHYAEDDGKSEKEIAAITKPEVTYLFNATGVLIPKKQ